MTSALAKAPIKQVELKNGSVRYRFVADVGADPITGKRQQKTHTFDSYEEAERSYEQIRSRRRDQWLRGVTINEILDDFMGSLTCAEQTQRGYASTLEHLRNQIGNRKAKAITATDIDTVITHMMTRGGRSGSGLSPRTANLAVNLLRSAYELAVLNQKITKRVIPIENRPSMIVRG